MGSLTYYTPVDTTLATNLRVFISELTPTEITYTAGTGRSVYNGSFNILNGTLVGGTVTRITSYQGSSILSIASGFSDNLVTLQQALATLNPAFYYATLLGPNAVVQGSPGNDTLTGGPGTSFIGGGGNDVVRGTGGISTLVIPFGYRGVTVPGAAGGALVTPSGTDTISNIQDLVFVDGRVTFDSNDHAAQTTRLYQAALGRAPDQAGLAGWTASLDRGASLKSVALGFLASPEFKLHYPSAAGSDNGGFIEQLYRNVLHRGSDVGGKAGWVAQLSGGALDRAGVLTDFAESTENVSASSLASASGIWVADPVAAQVARLYDTALGRRPEVNGLAAWKNDIEGSQLTLGQVATQFVASTEFQGKYGSLNSAAFVTALYANTLHRAPDAGGLAGWVGALAHGLSRGDVVIGFSESPEHVASTAADVLTDNKALYGIHFA